MDNEQEAQHLATDPGFELVPPEADDQAVGAAADDDSDAPIRLDDLTPDEPAGDALESSQEVRAENVAVSQGSAQMIEATTVTITQGAAAQVIAEQVTVRQGALALTRSENVTLESESFAFAAYADSARVESGANVFMLLARSVGGEIRPVLDWRSALAMGAAFALVSSILRRIR